MDWYETAGSPSRWDEAWVWSDVNPPPMYVPSNIFAGYATFDEGPDASWSLVRVWLRPVSRRSGLLREVWPLWQERYRDFRLVRPSEAMQRFLSRAGYGPEARALTERPIYWAPLVSTS